MQFKVFLALPNIHHHNQARLQQEKPWGCIQLCSHVVFISHELVISYVRALFALFLLVQQSQCKFSTFVPVERYSTRSEMWVLCREDRVAQTKAFSAEELWRWAEASEGINARTSRSDLKLFRNDERKVHSYQLVCSAEQWICHHRLFWHPFDPFIAIKSQQNRFIFS